MVYFNVGWDICSFVFLNLVQRYGARGSRDAISKDTVDAAASSGDGQSGGGVGEPAHYPFRYVAKCGVTLCFVYQLGNWLYFVGLSKSEFMPTVPLVCPCFLFLTSNYTLGQSLGDGLHDRLPVVFAVGVSALRGAASGRGLPMAPSRIRGGVHARRGTRSVRLLERRSIKLVSVEQRCNDGVWSPLGPLRGDS